MFKINGFIFHDEVDLLMENVILYIDSYFLPLENLAISLGVFSEGAISADSTNIRKNFVNEDLYSKILEGEDWAEFGLELLTGEIEFCTEFECAQSYEVSSLLEAFSFINTTQTETSMQSTGNGFLSLLKSSATKASRTLFENAPE